MTKKSTINQEEFEKFLNWLDADREIAGKKYETIRLRLIKIFSARGCHIAEELADESIDRVIKKCGEISKDYKGDPALYCYGVAKNVFLEFTRSVKTEELSAIIAQIETDLRETETDYRCLNKCLSELMPEQYEIITVYYVGDKKTKVERRRKLEQKLKITNESLRVRAFRIRGVLRKCIANCIGKNSNETF